MPDASATLPWRFADEATTWTEALLDRIQGGEEVFVPAHWPLEVANALLIARRRGRVTAEQISEFIEDLAGLPIRLEPPSGPAQWPAILALAEQHRLTAYDAAYLELVEAHRAAAHHARWRSAKSGGVRRRSARVGNMSTLLIGPSSEITLPAP